MLFSWNNTLYNGSRLLKAPTPHTHGMTFLSWQIVA